MNKLLSRLLVCCLTLSVFAQTKANESIEHFNVEQFKAEQSKVEHFKIEQFKIEQGVASFTQEKKFTFLTTPIKSSGIFKVYNNNILWQVNSPVFSKLLIIDSEIFQYEEVKTVEGISHYYRKMATHASIETLIQAVFTGTINKEQWNATEKNDRCLLLEPKDTMLVQAISLLELCLGEQEGMREVLITDIQKNTTKISLTQTSTTLSDDDVNEFNIH